MDPGRRAHYAGLYDPVEGGDVAVVWGNCQAESLRVLLAGSATFPLRTVRLPPVHELTAGDLPALAALFPRIRLLVSQPVRAGYRGLPIGTSEVAVALRRWARIITVPVFRYQGLHPYSAIVRHPADPGVDPPVVPYHDLRTLARAAGRRRGQVGADALRRVAADSVAELARRERDTDVAVSDVLGAQGAAAAHTLNHPGNGVLIELARRVQAHLGVAQDASDPGRDLLGGVRAPLEREVVDALGLDTEARPCWRVGERSIDPAEVAEAQLGWYRQNPSVVAAGIERHADRLATLGL